MIIALKIDREIDLSSFSNVLFQLGIWHRIAESGENQTLSVENSEDEAKVQALYERFSSGEISFESLSVDSRSKGRSTGAVILSELLRVPLVLTLLLASLICFPITFGSDIGDFGPWFHLMTLLDFKLMGDQIYFANLDYTFSSGQYWRVLTPMFLHFGWMHIVFNSLWIWEIGKRIEKHSGALVLLLLVVVSSASANLIQYWISGAGLFGGMSGVVFGLLAYSLTWHLVLPDKTLSLSKGIYIFMLAYLVIGFTGAIDLLGLGSLANGAHLGGLIGGVIIGLLALLTKYLQNRYSRGSP